MSKRGELRGLTLLEILVASILVTVLALALATVALPMQRATSDVGIAWDQDKQARLAFTKLSKDIRGTGYTNSGVEKISVLAEAGTTETAEQPTAGADLTLITFHVRTGPDDLADWSTAITYKAVATGTFANTPSTINRFQLVRNQDGQDVVLANDVSKLKFNRPAGGNTLHVNLELTRASTDMIDGVPAKEITRKYEIVIEWQNRKP